VQGSPRIADSVVDFSTRYSILALRVLGDILLHTESTPLLARVVETLYSPCSGPKIVSEVWGYELYVYELLDLATNRLFALFAQQQSTHCCKLIHQIADCFVSGPCCQLILAGGKFIPLAQGTFSFVRRARASAQGVEATPVGFDVEEPSGTEFMVTSVLLRAQDYLLSFILRLMGSSLPISPMIVQATLQLGPLLVLEPSTTRYVGILNKLLALHPDLFREKHAVDVLLTMLSRPRIVGVAEGAAEAAAQGVRLGVYRELEGSAEGANAPSAPPLPRSDTWAATGFWTSEVVSRLFYVVSRESMVWRDEESQLHSILDVVQTVVDQTDILDSGEPVRRIISWIASDRDVSRRLADLRLAATPSSDGEGTLRHCAASCDVEAWGDILRAAEVTGPSLPLFHPVFSEANMELCKRLLHLLVALLSKPKTREMWRLVLPPQHSACADSSIRYDFPHYLRAVVLLGLLVTPHNGHATLSYAELGEFKLLEFLTSEISEIERFVFELERSSSQGVHIEESVIAENDYAAPQLILILLCVNLCMQKERLVTQRSSRNTGSRGLSFAERYPWLHLDDLSNLVSRAHVLSLTLPAEGSLASGMRLSWPNTCFSLTLLLLSFCSGDFQIAEHRDQDFLPLGEFPGLGVISDQMVPSVRQHVLSVVSNNSQAVFAAPALFFTLRLILADSCGCVIGPEVLYDQPFKLAVEFLSHLYDKDSLDLCGTLPQRYIQFCCRGSPGTMNRFPAFLEALLSSKLDIRQYSSLFLEEPFSKGLTAYAGHVLLHRAFVASEHCAEEREQYVRILKESLLLRGEPSPLYREVLVERSTEAAPTAVKRISSGRPADGCQMLFSRSCTLSSSPGRGSGFTFMAWLRLSDAASTDTPHSQGQGGSPFHSVGPGSEWGSSQQALGYPHSQGPAMTLKHTDGSYSSFSAVPSTQPLQGGREQLRHPPPPRPFLKISSPDEDQTRAATIQVVVEQSSLTVKALQRRSDHHYVESVVINTKELIDPDKWCNLCIVYDAFDFARATPAEISSYSGQASGGEDPGKSSVPPSGKPREFSRYAILRAHLQEMDKLNLVASDLPLQSFDSTPLLDLCDNLTENARKRYAGTGPQQAVDSPSRLFLSTAHVAPQLSTEEDVDPQKKQPYLRGTSSLPAFYTLGANVGFDATICEDGDAVDASVGVEFYGIMYIYLNSILVAAVSTIYNPFSQDRRLGVRKPRASESAQVKCTMSCAVPQLPGELPQPYFFDFACDGPEVRRRMNRSLSGAESKKYRLIREEKPAGTTIEHYSTPELPRVWSSVHLMELLLGVLQTETDVSRARDCLDLILRLTRCFTALNRDFVFLGGKKFILAALYASPELRSEETLEILCQHVRKTLSHRFFAELVLLQTSLWLGSSASKCPPRSPRTRSLLATSKRGTGRLSAESDQLLRQTLMQTHIEPTMQYLFSQLKLLHSPDLNGFAELCLKTLLSHYASVAPDLSQTTKALIVLFRKNCDINFRVATLSALSLPYCAASTAARAEMYKLLARTSRDWRADQVAFDTRKGKRDLPLHARAFLLSFLEVRPEIFLQCEQLLRSQIRAYTLSAADCLGERGQHSSPADQDYYLTLKIATKTSDDLLRVRSAKLSSQLGGSPGTRLHRAGSTSGECVGKSPTPAPTLSQTTPSRGRMLPEESVSFYGTLLFSVFSHHLDNGTLSPLHIWASISLFLDFREPAGLSFPRDAAGCQDFYVRIRSGELTVSSLRIYNLPALTMLLDFCQRYLKAKDMSGLETAVESYLSDALDASMDTKYQNRTGTPAPDLQNRTKNGRAYPGRSRGYAADLDEFIPDDPTPGLFASSAVSSSPQGQSSRLPSLEGYEGLDVQIYYCMRILIFFLCRLPFSSSLSPKEVTALARTSLPHVLCSAMHTYSRHDQELAALFLYLCSRGDLQAVRCSLSAIHPSLVELRYAMLEAFADEITNLEGISLLQELATLLIFWHVDALTDETRTLLAEQFHLPLKTHSPIADKCTLELSAWSKLFSKLGELAELIRVSPQLYQYEIHRCRLIVSRFIEAHTQYSVEHEAREAGEAGEAHETHETHETHEVRGAPDTKPHSSISNGQAHPQSSSEAAGDGDSRPAGTSDLVQSILSAVDFKLLFYTFPTKNEMFFHDIAEYIRREEETRPGARKKLPPIDQAIYREAFSTLAYFYNYRLPERCADPADAPNSRQGAMDEQIALFAQPQNLQFRAKVFHSYKHIIPRKRLEVLLATYSSYFQEDFRHWEASAYAELNHSLTNLVDTSLFDRCGVHLGSSPDQRGKAPMESAYALQKASASRLNAWKELVPLPLDPRVLAYRYVPQPCGGEFLAPLGPDGRDTYKVQCPYCGVRFVARTAQEMHHFLTWTGRGCGICMLASPPVGQVPNFNTPMASAARDKGQSSAVVWALSQPALFSRSRSRLNWAVLCLRGAPARPYRILPEDVPADRLHVSPLTDYVVPPPAFRCVDIHNLAYGARRVKCLILDPGLHLHSTAHMVPFLPEPEKPASSGTAFTSFDMICPYPIPGADRPDVRQAIQMIEKPPRNSPSLPTSTLLAPGTLALDGLFCWVVDVHSKADHILLLEAELSSCESEELREVANSLVTTRAAGTVNLSPQDILLDDSGRVVRYGLYDVQASKANSREPHHPVGFSLDSVSVFYLRKFSGAFPAVELGFYSGAGITLVFSKPEYASSFRAVLQEYSSPVFPTGKFTRSRGGEKGATPRRPKAAVPPTTETGAPLPDSTLGKDSFGALDGEAKIATVGRKREQLGTSSASLSQNSESFAELEAFSARGGPTEAGEASRRLGSTARHTKSGQVLPSRSTALLGRSVLGDRSFAEMLDFSEGISLERNYDIGGLQADYASGTLPHYHFLMAVNYLAGRSFTNIYAYPILPLLGTGAGPVLGQGGILNTEERDSSAEGGLTGQDRSDSAQPVPMGTKSCAFRDLCLPIGLQCAEAAAIAFRKQEQFRELQETELGSPVTADSVPLFRTYISTSSTAPHFLFRVEPFTAMQRWLQSGSLDVPARMFLNYSSQWHKVLLGQSGSEGVPELFSLAEPYFNGNGLDIFPPREEGQGGPGEKGYRDICDFCTRTSACAVGTLFQSWYSQILNLEASDNDSLALWVDLVFGSRQTRYAVQSHNTYLPYVYLTGTDVLKATFFGTAPLQVFKKRLSKNGEPLAVPTRKLRVFSELVQGTILGSPTLSPEAAKGLGTEELSTDAAGQIDEQAIRVWPFSPGEYDVNSAEYRLDSFCDRRELPLPYTRSSVPSCSWPCTTVRLRTQIVFGNYCLSLASSGTTLEVHELTRAPLDKTAWAEYAALLKGVSQTDKPAPPPSRSSGVSGFVVRAAGELWGPTPPMGVSLSRLCTIELAESLGLSSRDKVVSLCKGRYVDGLGLPVYLGTKSGGLYVIALHFEDLTKPLTKGGMYKQSLSPEHVLPIPAPLAWGVSASMAQGDAIRQYSNILSQRLAECSPDDFGKSQKIFRNRVRFLKRETHVEHTASANSFFAGFEDPDQGEKSHTGTPGQSDRRPSLQQTSRTGGAAKKKPCLAEAIWDCHGAHSSEVRGILAFESLDVVVSYTDESVALWDVNILAKTASLMESGEEDLSIACRQKFVLPPWSSVAGIAIDDLTGLFAILLYRYGSGKPTASVHVHHVNGYSVGSRQVESFPLRGGGDMELHPLCLCFLYRNQVAYGLAIGGKERVIFLRLADMQIYGSISAPDAICLSQGKENELVVLNGRVQVSRYSLSRTVRVNRDER